MTLWEDNMWAVAMVQEALGAFIVCFFFLMQSEEATKFSKEKSLNSFISASSYVGARAMLNGVAITASGPVLNPAIGLGTCLV